MPTGTVKWFNSMKGYGFIAPDDGEQDVFVHISAVEQADMRTLNEGQKISYEIATERGKTSAANLQAGDLPSGWWAPSPRTEPPVFHWL